MSPVQISALWGQADCFGILAAAGSDMTDIATWIDEKPSLWSDLDAQQRAAIRLGKKACKALIKTIASKPKI
jgi:hypothetical protein